MPTATSSGGQPTTLAIMRGPSASASADATGLAVFDDLLPGGYAVRATTADGGAVGETTAAVTADRPVVVRVFTVPTSTPPSTEVPPPSTEFPPSSFLTGEP